MKKMFAGLLLLSMFFMGCNKKSDDSGNTVVTYQVTATNSSGIAISYTNVLGNKIQVNAQSGWTIDVTISQKPFQAFLQASSTSPTSAVQTSCTANILVTGAVVKTATISSNTVAVAEANYTVQ